MDNTTSVWLIIAVAAVLANVPFLNNRWLALLPKRDPTSRKGLQSRLLELVVMYVVVVFVMFCVCDILMTCLFIMSVGLSILLCSMYFD